MSQVGRQMKNLEAPRPLKSSMSRTVHQTPLYGLQTIEELITLVESVAGSLSTGQCNPDSMTLLLTNLRMHGPQLEEYSKSTLDQAYVKFRNASQDERLSIIARMNLLELIELRAKSWQVSEDISAYYKLKASDVQPENNNALHDFTLLDASPITTNILAPGELIRVSGKFIKPTKIPGKNYSKDEVVIRNADSGKVMGIKGRRVHMIEELSETIISFQRVNPGAKERLVQITGPNEDKINYAKQLIEDTIRRNASPVRIDDVSTGVAAAGSCSSLTSSNSDEMLSRVNRHSGMLSSDIAQVAAHAPFGVNAHANQFSTSSYSGHKSRANGANVNQTLLHSLSTNDASLGEYKYTVNVGANTLKITGESLDLVRMAKLVLDEYFSSSEFISCVDAAETSAASPMMPTSYQSPFVDSGIGLNMLASQHFGNSLNNQTSVDTEDDVFVTEKDGGAAAVMSPSTTSTSSNQTSSGIIRSRRSHFTHGEVISGTKRDDKAKSQSDIQISYENERMIYFAKSPHSWTLPRDWDKICEQFPNIVRNKNLEDETNRFDAEKYLQFDARKVQLTGADVDDSKSGTPSDTDE